MRPCPYCDMPCEPTREHLVPAWFPRAVGSDHLETFNARSPTGHIRGDLLIRDVCASCNNVLLGDLDAYGQELFKKFFQHPVYYGESLEFQCDRSRLLRWLLKLSYNSARAHNADVTILRKYRRAILEHGTAEIRIPLYAHVIAPTDFSTIPPSPAYRILRSNEIVRPCWFRLTQFRPPRPILTEVVQRQIYINSFCFTILVPDPDRPDHVSHLEELCSLTEEWLRDAVELREDGYARLTPRRWHVYSCMQSLIQHYPTRYGNVAQSACPAFSNVIRQMVHGSSQIIAIAITREEIESAHTSGIVARLEELVRTREAAMASRQRVALFVDGYNDDPREVWQIPEARHFFQKLFTDCPYLFFLVMAEPRAAALEVLALCSCHHTAGAGGLIRFEPEQWMRFMETGFVGLNQLTTRLAISVEVNREISESVVASFVLAEQEEQEAVTET